LSQQGSVVIGEFVGNPPSACHSSSLKQAGSAFKKECFMSGKRRSLRKRSETELLDLGDISLTDGAASKKKSAEFVPRFSR